MALLDNTRLNLVGRFNDEEFEARIRLSAGWSKVNELGFVKRNDVADVPGRSRAGIVTYYPVPNYMEAQPNKLFEYMSAGLLDGLTITKPLGYLDTMMLMKNASAVATDSGGIQKEAYFHQVPCITLRDETEWSELVELGWNRLCSPLLGDGQIVNCVTQSIGRHGKSGTPYGGGDAAVKIIDHLLSRFN